MKYKLKDKDGKTVRTGVLAGTTTPRVILDSTVPAAYVLGETTDAFEYNEVTWLKIDE